MSVYVGIAEGHVDPAVAVVRDGAVVAYVEEDRLLRYKHAPYCYPQRALDWALAQAGVSLRDVTAVAVPWDIEAFADGRIAESYRHLAHAGTLDEPTRRWQALRLREYAAPAVRARHERMWRRTLGDGPLPPVRGVPHHFAHAVQAGLQSPYQRSVVLTADGSGETECTVVWEHRDDHLTALRRLTMPDSLGWFYAAVTEYLGFQAYRDEYKVMGLAAYGEPDPDLTDRFARFVAPAPDGVGYRVDPAYVHRGRHSWSGRFTDALCDLLGAPPRPRHAPLTDRHRAVAFAAQQALEEACSRLAAWALRETGLSCLALGGGVAHNVKMNGALLARTGATSVFAHPLCGDAGAAAGAALALSLADGHRPEPLTHLALGPAVDEVTTLAELRRVRCRYRRPADVASEVARALAAGAIVGWVDGRLEAGPRALGQRSILADPRDERIRDRVNQVVKQRERWRPFCPSLTAPAAAGYLPDGPDLRFMTIACPATARLRRDAPAVVHVDGTVRPQVIDADVQPRYHRLVTEFGRLTGVPVVLNTSFNLAGEPVVATVTDALRTFWSSGLDLLVLGDVVVEKPAEL
jgi:carbamoyltransferase